MARGLVQSAVTTAKQRGPHLGVRRGLEKAAAAAGHHGNRADIDVPQHMANQLVRQMQEKELGLDLAKSALTG